MLRLAKQVVLVVLFIVAAGCGGGGCSSGCSCGGITPLPEGFKPEKRIENGASVRVTDSGFQFISQNMGTLAGKLLAKNDPNGILTFTIPTSMSGNNPQLTVCDGGPDPNSDPPHCIAEIDLKDSPLTLNPQGPHDIIINGPLMIRLRDLPVHYHYCFPPFNFPCISDTIDVVLSKNKQCPGSQQDFQGVGLDGTDIAVSIDPDMQHSRYGYSRVKVTVNPNQSDIRNALEICTGNGIKDFIYNGILDLVGGSFIAPLKDQLNKQIDQQLCQKANDMLNPPCPSGTQDVGGICRYGSDSSSECASIVLGTEGHIDLGRFLQGISAGATGAFDFLLAAGGQDVRDDGTGEHWGDLNPIAGGATLGVYGGTEPQPVSRCVPPAAVELPTGIPIPDELLGNSVPNWPAMTPGPHFGLALSERFSNYALAQVYNSGALCIGIDGDAVSAQINSSLLALGLHADSLKELGHLRQPTSMAFLLRPQKPPTIKFGNGTDIDKDPLLDINIRNLAIDFYAWSADRYVRAMTVTTDLEVPANLTVAPDGLTPVVNKINLANTTVTNQERLIREPPEPIAAAIQSLVGSLLGGQLGKMFKPIDINKNLASLGLSLDIPDSMDGKGSPGLRKLTKGMDNFLGIFAGLSLAQMMSGQISGGPVHEVSATNAELLSFEVDPAGLFSSDVSGWTPDNAPRARIRLSSSLDDGEHAVEWQYRVDNQLWHPWSQARDLDLADEALRGQGVHRVLLRSRVAGRPETTGETTAVQLRVDDIPPEIRILKQADKRLRVEASDFVSGDKVLVRVRLGYGPNEQDGAWAEWSAWQPVTALAPFPYGDASLVQAQAKDEGENVGTVTEPLIRGAAVQGAGCQCALLPGQTEPRSLGWLAGAVLAGAALLRRRRSAAKQCQLRQCQLRQRQLRQRELPRRAARPAKKLASGAGIAVIAVIGLMPGCHCGGSVATATDCRSLGTCQVLEPGLVGEYASAAVAQDGTIWVAGYLEGNWDPAKNGGTGFPYGDLAVGTVDATSMLVQWKVVDGEDPSEQQDPNTYDPTGFRDGKINPGDDVGMWTSIALDAGGNPAVAYYDLTNHALKYADLNQGSWTVSQVKSGGPGSDYGRYAKLAFVNGAPVIAFHFIEPGPMTEGGNGIQSGVRLATGADSTGSSWTFEDVVADDQTPCKALLCASGQACLKTGACVAQKDGCKPDCASGESCVDDGKGGASCAKSIDQSTPVTYPNEVGLYVSLARASDGLRVGYYDRTRGNALVAQKTGGMWASVLVDGAGMKPGSADKGIGLSLAVDAQGIMHLAYVDGQSEALDYAMVKGGVPLPPEVVDDGLGGGEGHHVVGDDANIVVTSSGEVHISYMDATTGQLWLAVGTPNGMTHLWKKQALVQDGFGGWFSQQLPASNQIMNWWRVAGPLPVGDVRFVKPM